MNLYIHIPFCISRCNYCGFYSESADHGFINSDFPKLLQTEIQLRDKADVSPKTIYLGGGTPSQLGAGGISALFKNLPHPQPGAEITMELNPADVTPELAQAMFSCGVTRVSMGAQSFDNACLSFLGRRHRASDISRAVSTLCHAGFSNISLDLIAAVPGFDSDSLRHSLEQALTLSPKHISVYALSIEEGTPLAHDVATGTVHPLPDDEVLEQLAVAESALCHAGMRRYEISNYAFEGFECRHNLGVWRGEDYVGIGPAAATREGTVRRLNYPDLQRWREALESGVLPPAQIETLSREEDDLERFTTRLRLAGGQSANPATALGRERLETFRRLEKIGVVELLESGAYALTARGMEVADAVMAEF